MITTYEYLHARNSACDVAAISEYVPISPSGKLARLAEKLDALLVPAAREGRPAVLVPEVEVARLVAEIEDDDPDGRLRAAGFPEGHARLIVVRLVEYLRRNTQFRSIHYTGNDADFVIEP